ncbi:MAG TPA: alpha-amylase family glycosyl hydrolase [Gaiellaceae bacterium]|nr:alpha-amylase family glycosyl hydrolase [Gaiellaceae bacterium]
MAVRLVPGTGPDRCLAPGGGGNHEGVLAASVGDDYLFVLDGGAALPDPCSRFQPEGVRGASRIVDAAGFEVAPGPALARDELVVYELHVGTFSNAGTFAGVEPHLAALRELGVTAIELMPVATFPGDRGWGYDGLYLYAPHPAYGGPEGLAHLVDAAHRAGLGVILDVVFNHLGPGSEQITAFGPYVTDRFQTPWGGAIDYSRPAVREWAIQNAEQWVRDYRVDGLRLDAVFAIFDDESPKHVLAELRERLPETLLIAEQEPGNLRPIDEWGFDVQWADEFHHELHVALTGEQHGYYGGYGSLDGLAAQYERTPAEALVYCSQNHDQVGNRPFGDRPPPDELELRAHALLFAPQTPLLFMGEEYGEQSPFQFFTDHIDPAIAEATREGRRREFAFAGEVPDPQALETFENSKLSRQERPGMRELYTELLRLRRELPREARARADRSTVTVQRGDHELVLDFERRSARLT